MQRLIAKSRMNSRLRATWSHTHRINRSSIPRDRDLAPPVRVDYCHDLHWIDYHRDDPHPLASGGAEADVKPEVYDPKQQTAADQWAHSVADTVLAGDLVLGNE